MNMSEDIIDNYIDVFRSVFGGNFIYVYRGSKSANFNNGVELNCDYIIGLIYFDILEIYEWNNSMLIALLHSDDDKLRKYITNFSKTHSVKQLIEPIIHLYRGDAIDKLLEDER